MKVAELVQRFGLRASDYDAEMGYIDEEVDPEGLGYFFLRFHSIPTDPDKQEKVCRVDALLGVEGGIVKREWQHDLEDVLDDALAQAPRPRFR